jgi:hypothetical protein
LKLLRRLVIYAFWSLVAVYAAVLMAVRLPYVQTRLAGSVAGALTDKLGTRACIGNIDVGFLNRIIIDSLRIDDPQGLPLLQAGRLTARFDPVSLLMEGKADLSSVQVLGAHIRLNRPDANSPTNFQFVLDSLTSKDTTSHSSLRLHIGSVIMRNTSIEWHQLDLPEKGEGLDPAHLRLGDINAYIRLYELSDTCLNLQVRRLAMKEKSGLEVQRLAFNTLATPSRCTVSQLVLQMPHSRISLDSLVLSYKSAEPKLFKAIEKNTLAYSLSLPHSTLVPADLAPLLPPLKEFTDSLSITAQLQGTDSTLSLRSLDVWGPLTLNTTAQASRRQWRVDIARLGITQQLANQAGRAFGIDDLLGERTGSMEMNGVVRGTSEKQVEADLRLNSASGSATVKGSIDPKRHFQAEVEARDLQLERLTGSQLLGTLDGTVRGEGVLDGKESRLQVKTDIQQVTVKGYAYHDIHATANYAPHEAEAILNVDDPNLQAEIKASAQRKQGNLAENLAKDLAKADLRLSAHIAHIAPHRLHLTQHGEDFSLEHLRLSALQEDGERSLDFTGTEGNLHIFGHFDPSSLPNSVADIVCQRLPMLGDLLKLSPKRGADSFNFSAQLSDAEWLQRFFDIPLKLHSSFNVMGSVDAQRNEISLLALMPDFSYNGTRYQEAQLSLTTPTDSMVLQTQLTRYDDNQRPLRLNLDSHAANEKIGSRLSWTDLRKTEHFGGQLSSTILLDRLENGQPQATVQIEHSNLVLKDTIWDVMPATIRYTDKRIDVDQLTISHEQQHITVNGTASDNKADTLLADLSDVDVAYILDLVNFHSVDFSGRASGKASLSAPFGKMLANANLTVRQFLFEGGRMGTLYALAKWNDELGQIDINATSDETPVAMTFINGFISPRHETIDLDIRAHNTRIDFLQSYTDAFLSNVSGNAIGNVRVAGPLSEINLTGTLLVKGQAHVDAIGTTYTLRNDTVKFIPDDILLDRIKLYDEQGHMAYLSGGVHHKHLTRMTFDLDVLAEDEPMLAYHFPNGDDQELFYGTVVAKGRVTLTGRPGETTINVDATTAPGTAFTYNTVQSGGIANQDFIVWKKSSDHTYSLQGEGTDTPAAKEDNQRNVSSDLRLNFLINATPEAELHLLMDANTGDRIVLNGNGILRATYYNKGTFQLFGTYHIDGGTYSLTIQNVIKKTFTFQPGGSIVFGGQPMNAALNLHALYTVHGVSLSDLNIGHDFASNTVKVNCIMNIGGVASAPQVDFNLELPTVNAEEHQMIHSLLSGLEQVNQQVVYLLGVGRFYNDQANTNQGSEQPDQTTLAMQSFLSGTLSGQVNTLLGRIIKNNDWNFGTNISTGTEGWRNAEYEGLVSGKMMDNRLLINGQFGYRDNAKTANSSFIGDFDIQYLLTRNGNLALKVYNQTNDRYFTRSSLNTQGIGIIMKRDFNGLKDLFGNRQQNAPSTPTFPATQHE